jgi:hypothetical protein
MPQTIGVLALALMYLAKSTVDLVKNRNGNSVNSKITKMLTAFV